MNVINKQKIIDYIEDRHQNDGGYFFAQVEPSSGLDTYLAVKTLRLLGAKIKNAKSIADFWRRETLEGNLNDLFAVYLAAKTYKELKLPITAFKKYQPLLIGQKNGAFSHTPSFHTSKNKKMNFIYAMDFISTIGKDLQDAFYLANLSRDLKFDIDKKKIADCRFFA